METERKIYINEEHPLNGSASAKIYLDTAKSRSKKVNSVEGTAIHLSTEKQDLGVHINTTYSITSSKKIKLLFLLNFMLSVFCMVVCFMLACYYWHEITALRRQIDLVKEQFVIQNVKEEKVTESSQLQRRLNEREGRARYETSDNAKKFFVEDLGEDMLLVDSKKKNGSDAKPSSTLLTTIQADLLIAEFKGASPEYKMGERSDIGPWIRDTEVSSKNSERRIQLNNDHVIIKESGLYLVYSQVVYLSHSPSTYYIWARKGGENINKPRLVSACGTGDDSTLRPLDRSQLSCSTHRITRLYAGDTVKITLREPNKTLVMRPGYTYLGFVKVAP